MRVDNVAKLAETAIRFGLVGSNPPKILSKLSVKEENFFVKRSWLNYRARLIDLIF